MAILKKQARKSSALGLASSESQAADEKRLDAVEATLDKMETKLVAMDKKFEVIENNIGAAEMHLDHMTDQDPPAAKQKKGSAKPSSKTGVGAKLSKLQLKSKAKLSTSFPPDFPASLMHLTSLKTIVQKLQAKRSALDETEDAFEKIEKDLDKDERGMDEWTTSVELALGELDLKLGSLGGTPLE